MPTQPLSRAEHRRRWEAYVNNDRDRTRAIKALGLRPGTFDSWLASFRATHGAEPPSEWFDEAPPAPDFTPAPPQSPPVVRVKAVTHETPPDGPIRKVVAIGDLHDNPTRSKDRFTWIGRYIVEAKPDNVVQIGDWLTLDSLSFHDRPGSRGYYERPNLKEDLDSLDETLFRLHREFAPGDFRCDITFGNHEERAWRVEEGSPNLRDTCVLPIEQAFSRYRWGQKRYGDWLFLEGVGFTHIPFNAVGRDFRGEHTENQIGPRAVFSLVFGHTHKEGHKTFPKIGPSKRIEVCNLGTALPYGEVEHYAGLSMTGWTYGIKELHLQGGHIVGHKFISMRELEERFG